MAPKGFEPAIPASERLQTYVLDRAATRIGFHDLHSSHFFRATSSRRMRLMGCVERRGGRWGAHRVLVGRPEGTKPLARSRFRQDNNITYNGSSRTGKL